MIKNLIKKIIIMTLVMLMILPVSVFAETNITTTQKEFSDVLMENWFYFNVLEMADLEIVNGYPDGTFKPQGNVKADEFLKMLIVGLNYEPIDTNGTYWAEGFVKKAEELN